MRLLLDEQYSREIAEQLRDRGHDVTAVKEDPELEGLDDEPLFRKARDDRRERNRDREGGPNYYIVRRHRVGEALLGLTRRMWAGHSRSPSKAAKLLGVKPSNVYSMISNGPGGPGNLRMAQG